VAQQVFLDLVWLSGRVRPEHLGGWLHRHTLFRAAKALRTQRRRTVRERIGGELMDGPAADGFAGDSLWRKVAPQLDASLDELSAPDRGALLLRTQSRTVLPEYRAARVLCCWPCGARTASAGAGDGSAVPATVGGKIMRCFFQFSNHEDWKWEFYLAFSGMNFALDPDTFVAVPGDIMCSRFCCPQRWCASVFYYPDSNLSDRSRP
jgi:hypothetical protein